MYLAFAEMNINIGIAGNYNKTKLSTDDYVSDFSGLELKLQPDFEYYSTFDSVFGFGANVSIDYSVGNFNLDTKNSSKYLFKKTEIIWYNSIYIPSKYNEPEEVLKFTFVPSFFIRYPINNKFGWKFSLGPSLSIFDTKFYISNKSDEVIVNHPNLGGLRVGYKNAQYKKISRFSLGLEGQVGLYMKSASVIQNASLYFRLGDFEFSELTNNTFTFSPSFSIGLIYKYGISIEHPNEYKVRLEKERLDQLEAQQKYIEDQQKKRQEKNAKISEQFGNKKIVELLTNTFPNPYAFDYDVIYHIEDYLYLHDWMSQGFTAGTVPKSAAVYYSDNIQLYIYSVPDIKKVNIKMADVYMIYNGVQEFINGYGAVIYLPSFIIVNCEY